MKRMYLVMGIVLAVLVMAIGVPVIEGATSSVETNSGTLATGTATATGAAINVSLGWTPREVVVTKVTNTLGEAKWQTGMAAASCLKHLDSATAASIITLPTVSCISTYAGSASAAKGFTLGADTDINVSGDTLRWRALR